MQSVSELINGFSRLKVLIIGDLMIDSYTWGRVSRISPEAPVPVVNVIRRESRLGGAGNVVLNIASLMTMVEKQVPKEFLSSSDWT